MSTKPKLFRDPVHDTIAIPTATDAGRMVLALMDCREVQRLRRIRQLGLSFLVYPGAEHSRFSHSLGVMWLTWTMLERLDATGKLNVDDDERLVTLAASLLHDVGHGPFSHAVESVTGVHHEAVGDALLRDPDTDVHRVLSTIDPTLPARVARRLTGDDVDETLPVMTELVTSQLDADRLDYILRDGRATGVRIGSYDLNRILALLDVVDGHLAVHRGAKEAVEGYLLARFHMYKQVYLHKTGRAAERMLEAALARAGELLDQGAPNVASGTLASLVRGEEMDAQVFCRLDDVDVWAALKQWGESSDPTLRDLSKGLVHRSIYKTLPLPTGDPRRAAELVSAARSIARVNGFDPDYAVLVDECRDHLYRPFTGVERGSGSIRIVDSAGRAGVIEDRSEVVQMLSQLELHQQLLCVHPALRDRIAKRIG